MTTIPTTPGLPPKPRGFGAAFWALNTIEMWERLAFYSVRTVAPIYIMQADNPGGLHLEAHHKGTIYAWWAAFQSLLPIVTGGFADRYGYKKTMAFSISLMVTGFLLMAFMRDIPRISNYMAFFTAIMVLATGTAFFKPSIQGSLAQNLHKDNSSMGWGIFYWVVNVGGFIGPFIARGILGDRINQDAHAWRTLFLCAAGFASLNFLMLLTFKDVPSGSVKTDSVLQVLAKTFTNIFEARLIAFLLIMSGFWLMMYQLWDLHPNFITDWVDSTGLARGLSWLPEFAYKFITEDTPRGRVVPQEMLININAACILIGVVPMAWVVRRMRTLSAMLIGMSLATVGILVAGLTSFGGVLAVGIVFFSLGEMLTGPKKSEYLGLIAPPGKKGLYLGYVNIPAGLGVFLGSKMAGYLYGHYGDKSVLAQKYLAQHTDAAAGHAWDGQIETLTAFVGVDRTGAMKMLQEVTQLNPVAATQLLWDTYHPQYYVWIPFAAVGVVSAVSLAIFGQMAKRWKDMNA